LRLVVQRLTQASAVYGGGVRFQHVAFDLDGTLIDSRADLTSAVNHVMRTLGRPELLPETLYRYVGNGARVLVERALGPDHQHHVEAGVAAFMAYYGEHLLDATRPYPGMVEALTALATRGVHVSVLTNKPVTLSRAILDGLALTNRFVDIIGGDSLPTRKPDPAGLLQLATRTNTPRQALLLVGDSPIDLNTARNAHVSFVGVGWGLTPDTLIASAPDHLIQHPAELIALVENGA
jgi:phosphoglycolate phosphatase